jgi:2-phospho-L-lactate/phosphoenolpyruvate guanylyltransferase
MNTWAIVPLKSPRTAKSRLADRLSPARRRALLFAMARHVLGTLQRTPGIDRIAIATASDEVAGFAAAHNVACIRLAGDDGPAVAFELALDALQSQMPDRVLMIAGDLPLLTCDAVRELLVSADRFDGPGVVLAPDRFGIGTNALLCKPPQLVAPRFGEESFSRHLAAVWALGVPHRVVERNELAFDLDTPADLGALPSWLAEVIGVASADPASWPLAVAV